MCCKDKGPIVDNLILDDMILQKQIKFFLNILLIL